MGDFTVDTLHRTTQLFDCRIRFRVQGWGYSLPLIVVNFQVNNLNTKPLKPTALEATHGQMDDFFSQLPFKYHLEEGASVGD